MTIAVDFDGTIVEHRYPAIGKERPFATVTLRRLVDEGHRLILWSVREGHLLDEAVAWCEERGVRFYAINRDFEEEDGTGHNYSRKIKADLFIDDRNVGGIPDWGTIYQLVTTKKTWEQLLMENGMVAEPKRKKRWGIF